MLKLMLLTMLSTLPAYAETLSLSCAEGSAGTMRIELQSRDLESYQLRENGKLHSRLKPVYQDEQMIQIDLGNTAYQFVNLGACVDSPSGTRTKTLLVVSEKLNVLRPFAAIPCSCLYR